MRRERCATARVMGMMGVIESQFVVARIVRP